jgi:hypothetical protein
MLSSVQIIPKQRIIMAKFRTLNFKMLLSDGINGLIHFLLKACPLAPCQAYSKFLNTIHTTYVANSHGQPILVAGRNHHEVDVPS